MYPLTILVTGASGFIGSWLVPVLTKALPNSSIVGVGRQARYPLESTDFANYEYVSCDLLEPAEFQRHLPSKADVIIHLAGDPRAFLKPEESSHQIRANVTLTSNVLDYAVSAKTELFMLASSVYVYSGNFKIPFREEEVGVPAENLGATKIAAEALVKARAVSGCFRSLAFRIFTTYGPRSRHTQFIPQAIQRLRSGEPTARFGASDVKRDFIYVEDVAAAFLSGLSSQGQKQAHEAFNVGSGTATSIKEIVFLLAELMGTQKPIEFLSGRSQNKADHDHQADLGRIQTALGWKPVTLLREGLRRAINSGAVSSLND